MAVLPETTVKYKTFIKTSLVEGLRTVFSGHPDPLLRGTKVTIDFPQDRSAYPVIIVRFYERDIENIGVGHVEFLIRNPEDAESAWIYDKYKHYIWHGDVEFSIYALSSLDRDLLADSVVQTLSMGDLLTYTSGLRTRIFEPTLVDEPDSLGNYINLNTDRISGFGETQVPAPWLPEDVLVYQTAYRVGGFGEFYSLPPVIGPDMGLIQRVKLYPYIGGINPVPTGDAANTNDWV